MIAETLRATLQKNSNQNQIYVRSLLKESLQDFILSFVYNDKTYNDLIFTGGTCLKKVYGLNRLSEDLDFNYISDTFSIGEFETAIKSYFSRELQYPALKTKLTGNKRTVLLKFPILNELGLQKNKAESNDLFVRCDFALEKLGVYDTEINTIATSPMTLYVKSFNLPTLFANKLDAFLTRDYFRGDSQSLSFKGRDVYDLVWFVQRSKKIEWKLQPNWVRLFTALQINSKEVILNKVLEKSQKIDPRDLYNDLVPFLENPQTVTAFCNNFASVLSNDLKGLL